MELQFDSDNGIRYAINGSKEECIRTTADFMDLLERGTNEGTQCYLLRESNFSRSFYDLKTGLAGEILQKCSTYRVRLAIVGSFEAVTSPRFRELMSEANKGSEFHFGGTDGEAVAWLVSGGDH